MWSSWLIRSLLVTQLHARISPIKSLLVNSENARESKDRAGSGSIKHHKETSSDPKLPQPSESVYPLVKSRQLHEGHKLSLAPPSIGDLQAAREWTQAYSRAATILGFETEAH